MREVDVLTIYKQTPIRHFKLDELLGEKLPDSKLYIEDTTPSINRKNLQASFDRGDYALYNCATLQMEECIMNDRQEYPSREDYNHYQGERG